MNHDRVVAAGDTFLVTDADGRTDGTNGEHAGLYHRDTRALDRYDLDGDLEPITSVATRPGERVAYLGRPQVEGARTRHVTRTQFVRPGRLCERLAVSNLTDERETETVSLRLGSRFDDLFEVREYVDTGRERVVTVDRLDGSDETVGGVRFGYDPADIDRRWETRIECAILGDGEGAVDVALDTGEEDERGRADARIDVRLALAGHETRTVEVAVAVGDGGEDQVGGRTEDGNERPSVRDRVAAAESWVRDRAAEWERETALDTERWPDVVAQSRDDLLDLRLGSGVFAAGIPWYATAFGRDSIIAAYQALPLSADPAVATCRFLASQQADETDESPDAEPGKIMHELRQGELAARGAVPHTPYYGTVDATPLFVTLVHETWRWTGDNSFLADLWPHVERALAWCEWRTSGGAAAGGGGDFLAYPTDGLLRNVGWKDSPDGVVYPDGELAAGPVALAEVQGYLYDARRRGAELARQLGNAATAAALDSAATRLRERFDEAFWVDSEETYAVALDGDARVETVTTNPGHCLWSGIVPRSRAERVVERLLADDVFSGWGLRTLASSHAAYNPQSYHRGSVWPHDTALCALGMARYGFDEAARTVSEGLLAAARASDDRLPELFAGFDRTETVVPVEYGSACEPQAWAAGAPVACLRAVGAVDGPDVDPGL